MDGIGRRWVGDGGLDMMIRHKGGKGDTSIDGHQIVVEAIK